MINDDSLISNYKIQSTSYNSAKVIDPIVISETSSTRRVLFIVLNDSKLDSKETVSAMVVHQRKKINKEWEDVESINLATLKGGEGIKLNFDSKQTRKFYEALRNLYKISEKGVQMGEHEFAVAQVEEIIDVSPENKKNIIQFLSKQYGEDIWSDLINNNPDLGTRLSIARIQAERKLILEEFKTSLNELKSEDYWQEFFSDNQWIFGYGLKYNFLNLITKQPHYGAQNIYGTGNQRGDFLLNTEAEIRFTVLVEIKKPDTPIIAKTKSNTEDIKYRNDAWLLSSDLLGGVSQLQVNCNTWLKNSQTIENVECLSKESIYTVNPKGMLVIGNTSQFKKDRSKIKTFELFRRSLNNPEVITFDELYERAKYIVETNNCGNGNK